MIKFRNSIVPLLCSFRVDIFTSSYSECKPWCSVLFWTAASGVMLAESRSCYDWFRILFTSKISSGHVGGLLNMSDHETLLHVRYKFLGTLTCEAIMYPTLDMRIILVLLVTSSVPLVVGVPVEPSKNNPQTNYWFSLWVESDRYPYLNTHPDPPAVTLIQQQVLPTLALSRSQEIPLEIQLTQYAIFLQQYAAYRFLLGVHCCGRYKLDWRGHNRL